MKAEYIGFYLEGRDDKLLKNDIDEDEVAKKIASGHDFRACVHEAAVDAGKSFRFDERKKKKWLAEHADAIKEAGGANDLAWGHYVDGRIDELAATLEPDVVVALDEEICGEEEGDEDEDADEDEDEEEGEDDGGETDD